MPLVTIAGNGAGGGYFEACFMTATGYHRLWRRAIPSLLAIMLLALYQRRDEGGALLGNDASDDGSQEVQAYREQRSGVWIAVSGRVVRTLLDDSEGSRHQRFILHVDNQHTVLVAHNVDIPSRVPIKMKDNVAVYGRYEWNGRGCGIHWTHRDPNGDSKGGRVEYQGHRFR